MHFKVSITSKLFSALAGSLVFLAYIAPRPLGADAERSAVSQVRIVDALRGAKRIVLYYSREHVMDNTLGETASVDLSDEQGRNALLAQFNAVKLVKNDRETKEYRDRCGSGGFVVRKPNCWLFVDADDGFGTSIEVIPSGVVLNNATVFVMEAPYPLYQNVWDIGILKSAAQRGKP